MLLDRTDLIGLGIQDALSFSYEVFRVRWFRTPCNTAWIFFQDFPRDFHPLLPSSFKVFILLGQSWVTGRITEFIRK